MSPAGFLAELRQRGGVVRLDGDHLRCQAPPAVLTQQVVGFMQQHKTYLIALLVAEAAIDPDGLLLRAAVALFDGELVRDMTTGPPAPAQEDIAQAAQPVAEGDPMKATTAFLNEIVLINQPRKLTPQDRAAVRQYLRQRWDRTSPAGRDLLLTEATHLLAHYGWRDRLTRLVVRLIAEGVGGKDELLARAWRDRRTKGQPLLQEAIGRYAL